MAIHLSFRMMLIAALAGAATSVAQAATITLDYNGFNPGEDVTLRDGTTPATILDTQAAGVAGDSASTFSFDLTTSGDYIIDLFGNVSDSATRSSHQLKFTYDAGSGEITNIINGSDKIKNFSVGTMLTLNTVPIYIDPQGYNPALDSSNGYKVQIEVGTSGRINLGESLSPANGGKSLTVLNGLHYEAQYDPASNGAGEKQDFTLTGGAVASNTGLVDEGGTVDGSGGTGTTHQLVRFNVKSIAINTSGLSYALTETDDHNYKLNPIPAGFNGTLQVLAGNPTGYELSMPRMSEMNLDVDADGHITADVSDPRFASVVGGTLTLRTAKIQITAPDGHESDSYNLKIKQNQTKTNMDTLLTALAGDEDLTLLPNDSSPAVYYLEVSGHLANDARDSWKIVYDPTTQTFSFATWQDADGTQMLTSLNSVTTTNGYTISFASVPEPASAAILLFGGALLLPKRRHRQL